MCPLVEVDADSDRELHHVALPYGIDGWVAIDRLVNGVAAGGLRVHRSVDAAEVRALASAMSDKWALMGIPLGGAKAGIAAPADHPHKGRLLEAFAEHLSPLLQERLITGPDMGTTFPELESVFAIAGVDPIAQLWDAAPVGPYRPPAGLTLHELGTLQVPDITGRGVGAAALAAMGSAGVDIAVATAAVQGFGAVGAAAAEEFVRHGGRVVAIADELGSLCADALPISSLRRITDAHGRVDRAALAAGTTAALQAVRQQGPDAWWQQEVTLLIPAAVADAITPAMVPQLRCQALIEGGNIVASPSVEEALVRRGVKVVPDVIAGAGLACAFGLLGTGQAPLENLGTLTLHRIAGATHALLHTGLEPRAAVRELVAQIEAVPQDSGEVVPWLVREDY